MPTNIEDKLAAFSAIVINDAREKREQLLEQTEREYRERIDKKETELLEGAYNEIQSDIRAIGKNANEQILRAELDAKKRLIVKREEIIAAVIDAAAEKLNAFTESEDYKPWLLKKAEKAVKETGEGKKTVYLAPRDMKYSAEIEKLAGDITVTETAMQTPEGGVRVLNTDKRVAADYTLSELLSEQQQGFLRESGLSIDYRKGRHGKWLLQTAQYWE